MKRRKKRSSSLGGTKSEHVTAAGYRLQKAEASLALAQSGRPCAVKLDHLVHAAKHAEAAESEASWVGKTTSSDERLHSRLNSVVGGIKDEMKSFAKRCVR